MGHYNDFELSKEQLDFVIENNGKMSYNKMSKELKVSAYFIRVAMKKNNIPFKMVAPKNIYRQINLTISEEHQKYLLENWNNMSLNKLSRELKITPGKLSHNAKVLKLVKDYSHRTPVFELNGYFDVDKFGKYYSY